MGLAELARAYNHKGDVMVARPARANLTRSQPGKLFGPKRRLRTLDEMASSNASLATCYGDALSTEDSEGGVLAPTTQWRKIAFGEGAKRALYGSA